MIIEVNKIRKEHKMGTLPTPKTGIRRMVLIEHFTGVLWHLRIALLVAVYGIG